MSDGTNGVVGYPSICICVCRTVQKVVLFCLIFQEELHSSEFFYLSKIVFNEFGGFNFVFLNVRNPNITLAELSFHLILRVVGFLLLLKAFSRLCRYCSFLAQFPAVACFPYLFYILVTSILGDICWIF